MWFFQYIMNCWFNSNILNIWESKNYRSPLFQKHWRNWRFSWKNWKITSSFTIVIWFKKRFLRIMVNMLELGYLFIIIILKVLFCFGGVFGLLLHRGFVCNLFFFWMAPSLHPLSIRDTPCPHCYSLYILGDLLKHVNNVHPPLSLVS